jgi:mannose-6-phosphate isomerase-like protein (cupin superfamily)
VTVAVARADPDALLTEPDNHLQLAALVAGEDCGGQISVTWVRIDGRHRRLRTRRCTRVYVVLDGALEIEDADGAVAVAAGEVATIPRGAAYTLEGTATYLVINAPAFVDGDDEYL